MPNISKIRKFPRHFYVVYEWNKKERGRWVNVWFGEEDFIGKANKKYPQNGLWTIKEVDEESSNHLYNRKWNPISIKIIPAFRYKQEKITPFDMKAQIHSIDDSSYGIWFKDKTLEELEEIRLKIIHWVDCQNLINGEEFLKVCEGYGGEGIDYN